MMNFYYKETFMYDVIVDVVILELGRRVTFKFVTCNVKNVSDYMSKMSQRLAPNSHYRN